MGPFPFLSSLFPLLSLSSPSPSPLPLPLPLPSLSPPSPLPLLSFCILKLHKTPDFVSISTPKWKRIWISCGVYVCFPICLLSWKLTFCSGCDMWQESGEIEKQELLNSVGKYSFLSSLENVKTLALKHCILFYSLSTEAHIPFFLIYEIWLCYSRNVLNSLLEPKRNEKSNLQVCVQNVCNRLI